MTPSRFIDACEIAWGGTEKKLKLMPKQASMYEEKLRRFTADQLGAIFEAVLEQAKHFPRIAEIYEVARSLGYIGNSVKADRPHAWKPTTCNLCVGSGVIAAFWSQEFELREGAKVQIMKLVGIGPYHLSAGLERKPHHEIRAVFRCNCLAGELETLPKGWPRWRGKDEPIVRERVWA